jgi:hypothetical protein
VRSNGLSEPRPTVVVARAGVAGVERFELAGGELVRACYGTSPSMRKRARRGVEQALRDAANMMGSAP